MELINLILKYNDEMLKVNTIEEHRKVIKDKGKVIWGIIKPKEGSPGIGKDKFTILNKQINEGKDTYAYMCTGGKIMAKARINSFLTSDEINELDTYVPEYYKDRLNTCVGGVLVENIEDENPNVINLMQRYNTVNGEVALGNQTNPLYVSFKAKVNEKSSKEENIFRDNSDKIDKDNIKVDEVEEYKIENIINNFVVSEAVEYIYNFIKGKGFIYDFKLISNFYTSLKTKPFVILSGISGTGKSKLVELFANAVGATTANDRFKLIPVKPDWSDATDLLGYRDIEGKFNPGIITEIAFKALLKPEVPHFVCLDEMNLARVEYYFSDVLSLMETRRFNDDDEVITNTLLSKEQIGRDEAAIKKYGDIYIPQNLYIIGTVNMDETTFPFSKKVLDRANTIEFNEVNLNYSFDDDSVEVHIPKVYHNNLLKSEFIKISQCKQDKDIANRVIKDLININNVLEVHNQHFGYRVRDEIVFYMIYAVRYKLMTYEEAFDYCVVQKILPKISGSSEETLDILEELFTLFNNYNFENKEYLDNNNLKAMENSISNSIYRLTNKKLIYMIRRFIKDGFTSFWQ